MNDCNPKPYTIPGGDAMHAERVTQRHPPPLLLAPLGGKTVELDCDGGRLSSDAGLVLLHDPEEQLGLTRALAAVLRAPRDPRRVDFTLHALLKQRVWHMAAGYEAANDANPLRHAPSCKVRRDRLPASGPPLASPPTLSRCEHRVSRTALSRLARVFVEQCIAAYDRPPTRIVLDCDDTEDPAHGEQEPSRDAGS